MAQNNVKRKSVHVNDHGGKISKAVTSHVITKKQIVKGRVVYNSIIDKRTHEGLLARGNRVKSLLVPVSVAVQTWVYKQSWDQLKGDHGQSGKCDTLENVSVNSY